MRIKEIKTFLKGLITSVEDHSIPDGAASDSKNWLTKGDKIELRRGQKLLGADVTEDYTLGNELITNGSFDSTIDGWSLDTLFGTGTFTWVAGAGSVNGGNEAGIVLYQDSLALDYHTSYLLEFDLVIDTPGSPYSLLPQFQSVSDGAIGFTQTIDASGHYSLTVDFDDFPNLTTLVDTLQFGFTPGFEGTIDNISLKEKIPVATAPSAGLHVTSKADGTQIPFRKRGRKLEYYDRDTEDWLETGSGIFPAAAEDDEASFADYASLAGNQMFVCSPNSGPFKIMTANPGSYTELTDPAKNFQGYIKIKQNRMVLWNRNKDKTGIYGSYIDAAAYTTVTNETIGTGDGSTLSFNGTLAFKAGGSTRTCFAVAITVTGGETFTDDYNGVLTGSAGGTGTINYTSGDWTLTFTVAPASSANNIKATYQWENSNNTGITDFTKSATRTAGQGFVFRQDDGGGDAKTVASYGDVEYCLHRLKTWELTLTADDTNATNLIYRDNVGLPNWRAAVATGDGVYFIDDYDQTTPKFRLLTLNNISTQVIPVAVSDALNLEDYRFDKGVAEENGDLITFECRHKNSAANDTTFIYDKRYRSFDRLDYAFACAAKYNGALIVGDSVTDNVFELFSGFDDNGSTISNYWEGNLTDLQIQELKKVKKLWVQGEISQDQVLKIYLAFDRGPYVLVGTQNGTDDNVDTVARPVLGSDAIGAATIGGTNELSVYNYIKEIKLQQGKFNHVKLKVEATGLGYISVSTITYHDIILHGQRLPAKYRANPNN